MSGAVAAHAAYNGSGTQGLAVTNRINDTGDVMSVFWTKNDTTRQLLHGSSLVEVVSTGSSGQQNSFGSSKIFTINNDVDVLGDIFLDLTLKVTPTFAATQISGSPKTLVDFELDQNFQYKLIDRVEFMVGTQIWHTLTGADIRVLTTTSKPESVSELMAAKISSERFIRADPVDSTFVPVFADISAVVAAPQTGKSETTRVVLWLPALSADISSPLKKFTDITENGYIMAAAPQQSVKIKVTFANSGSSTSDKITSTGFTDTLAATGTSNTVVGYRDSEFDSSLNNTGSVFVGFSNINRYPFERLVTGFAAAGSTAVVSANAGAITVDLAIDRVRMFAKQIMLCKEERDQIRSVPNGLPFRLKMTQSIKADVNAKEKTIDLDSFSLYASHLIITGDISGAYITEAELKLNSSSFSGSLPAILLKNDMAESLHLYSGSTLSTSHVTSVKELGVNLGVNELPMLIFPLASTAFSGSSVPLNRFDSIRLTLKFNDIPGVSTHKLNTNGINVTCVGETTVLYKGGAATLAMY
jgi:hypothetical protein